jgi:hypothetical protein
VLHEYSQLLGNGESQAWLIDPKFKAVKYRPFVILSETGEYLSAFIKRFGKSFFIFFDYAPEPNSVEVFIYGLKETEVILPWWMTFQPPGGEVPPPPPLPPLPLPPPLPG